MIALIQRVSKAGVEIDGSKKSDIDKGLLVLLGIFKGDTQEDADRLAKKTASLRIFADDAGKMNLSLSDIEGQALVVSQFTLCADTKKGNRPSFVNAAPPDEAVPLYEDFIRMLGSHIGANFVKTGEFGADMKVSLVNDGPVTISLNTRDD